MPRDYVLQPFRRPPDLQIDYNRELNEQQLAAVTAPPGPALVIAGAGSGKTRALTYRVAFLLEHGIPAERILLLTFTNKAAREMMRRVADLLGGDHSSLWGGTFHAVGHRILRRHAEQLEYRPDFTILDREDAKDLVSACLAEADIDVKSTRFPKAEVLGEIFSLAINRQQSIPEVLQENYRTFGSLAGLIEDVHRLYLARKRSTNVMDFDDLLALWLKLLQKHDAIREQYQRQFQFLLVDEYQDTNKLQSDLIDLLAARHHNVMVVGDDAQSIYSWRGADFQNVLQFPQRYPEAAVYKIEVNYRSTPEILDVANAAIAPNPRQFTKRLTPVRKGGTRPVVVLCADGNEQAAFVAQRILELREEGLALNRTAVLYRSHFHALELQLELTRRNIPFGITSGIRFFEQAHIKDVAAYLKLVCNPRDELAYKRLVQMLPGIGGKSADRLWKAYLRAFQKPESKREEPIAAALRSCVDALPPRAASGWAQFTDTVAQLEAEEMGRQPGRMIECVMEAGYQDYLEEHYANFRLRLEDLEQLAAFALQYPRNDEFLAQLSLLSNVEAETDRPTSGDDERIRLSTVHQAKGLEFDVVFIVMLCEGLFPSARSLERPEQEEEERRLFYVAVTRARNELYLSYPLIRMTRSRSADVVQQPSRFLRDIPAGLIEEWNLCPFDPYRPR